MKKILLYYRKTDIDRRIFPPTDYKNLWKEYGNNAGNSGNKLFIQACEQYLTKPDIEIEYFNDTMTADDINHKFDLILLPTANIFNRSQTVINWMNRHTAEFEKYKIPIIVLGAGVQAGSYDDLQQLSSDIKETAVRFIDAVYRTGGQFGLRGYFTEELFRMWGYTEAVVTGCPSMYQMGRNLKIDKKQIKPENFIPVINSDRALLGNRWWQKQFKIFKRSIYIDQGLFYALFYNQQFLKENELALKKAAALARQFSDIGIKLAHQGRIKLFYDIPVWLDYFQQEKISFSIGNRIHGNIAATLSGVPAALYACDMRTRELAEFFDIPIVENPEKARNIYEIYENVSYEQFNSNFPQKFDRFNKFLTDYGISYHIEDSSLFEKKKKEQIWNQPQVLDEAYIHHLYYLRKLGKAIFIK